MGEGIAEKNSEKCEYVCRDVKCIQMLICVSRYLSLVLSSGSPYQRYAFVVVINLNHRIAVERKK